MRFEAAFVAGYAVLLLAGSYGLHRLGRVSTWAWSSRMLAGYRAEVGEVPEPPADVDWPHSEVPRLHTALALVAALAATLLTAADLARHHRPVEVAVLGVVLCLSVWVVVRRLVGLRASVSTRAL